MRRHRASERVVLRALDELQRAGRIERRNGIGTFITGSGRLAGGGLPQLDADTVLAIAQPDASFFDRCLQVLHRVCVASGRRLVIHPMEPAEAVPLPAARPGGVLLFQYRFAALARQLAAGGCRVALVGAPPVDEAPPVPCVHSDHQYGGFLVTQHLLARGHRRVAMLGSGGELRRTLRWRGHQRALDEARRRHGAAGEAIGDGVLTQDDLAAWEAEPQRAVEWWRSEQGCTAIVAWNDHEAARLLAVFTRAHINVPDDVALAGYDDLPEGRVVHPPITTVDQLIEQQLRAALELVTRPKPPPASHVTVVTPTLVVRRSSDARVRT
jgi:DNA-binding LacI/PurR family transcriptional regulator